MYCQVCHFKTPVSFSNMWRETCLIHQGPNMFVTFVKISSIREEIMYEIMWSPNISLICLFTNVIYVKKRYLPKQVFRCTSIKHTDIWVCKTLFLIGYNFQDPSELLQFVRRDPCDLKYHCTLCNKFSHKNSYCSRNHVESHHFPNMFTYACDQCDMTFSSKSNYSMHRSRKHKQNQN